MPEASAASVACSPVSRSRMKSLGSSSLASRAAASGSFARSHSSLGAWKPVLARLPVIAMTRSRPEPAVDLVALGMGARVVPQAAPGGSDRRRRRGTPSRASGPTGRCRRRSCSLAVAARLRSTASTGLPPRFRLLLGPAGSRRQQGIGRGCPREHGAARGQQDALGAAGADVDADRDRLVGPCACLSCLSGRPALRRRGRPL